VIAINKQKQFIFVRQYRHALQSVNFELCAGVCEKTDISPLISAQRELLEETGYGNGVWEEYMNISPNPTTHTNITHCFLARDVEKICEQNLDTTEELTIHLLSFEDVKQLLFANEIKQSLMAAPLWKFVAENGL
jgi:ADP-ribose pyrophosphatase